VEFLPKPFSREALSKKLGEITKSGGGPAQ
jgi:hypothetical protein